MRGLRIRASEYDGASARGQFARGSGARTPTSKGRADIPGRVQWKGETSPQLDRLMKVIENGDRLIITRLDRIARSLIQGVQLLETLSEKGVIVEVLNMGIIDDTPTGKLMERAQREHLRETPRKRA